MPEEIKGDENFLLEDLLKKLLDVEGYVLFVGSLSNKVDEKGDRVLDFDYRRYHLSFEDAKTAVMKFKQAFMDDVTKGIDDGG